jgi:adenosine/AMP kinase
MNGLEGTPKSRARVAKAKTEHLIRIQAICDAWNAANPVGTPVMIKLDGEDETVATVTRSEAQILSGHSVVIWLKKVSGCYLLDRVRPAATAHERAIASAELKRLYVPDRGLAPTCESQS